MGFDFSISYRRGTENGAADALSRCPLPGTLATILRTTASITEQVHYAMLTDTTAQKQLLLACQKSLTNHRYRILSDLIFYKNRLFVPDVATLRYDIIKEIHTSPTGGHEGAFQTYKRLALNFFWPKLFRDVKSFVAACDICQQVKSDHSAPAGLLQPLPTPERIWEDISMDFIDGLPLSQGYTTIWVIVDCLSKYAHFVAVRHPYTAAQLAETFVREIILLHRVPRTIVWDRDPIFLSTFWKELFRLSRTTLLRSTAYHLQTDGQTEVVNRDLETYLHCFAGDQPQPLGQVPPLGQVFVQHGLPLLYQADAL